MIYSTGNINKMKKPLTVEELSKKLGGCPYVSYGATSSKKRTGWNRALKSICDYQNQRNAKRTK